MAKINGISEPFVPGNVEYKRVSFDIDKKKYYKPSRTSLLLLAGFGEIPGAQATQDQRTNKVKLTLESKVVDQMEFEILTHDPRVTQQTTLATGSLPTGSYGSTSTYTVTDGSILRPFDVIENMTTGEFLLITNVDTSASPDEITAYPAFQQTGFSGLTAFPWTLSNATPQAKTNGDTIRVVGVAVPVGSTATNIIDTRPTTAVNYVQIFREDFGMDYEDMQSSKNGRMDLADKDERAKANLLIKMEKALIEGAINKQSTTLGTVRTMQGIKGTVSTYNQAITALVGGGADLTVPKLDQIADQLAPANMSGRVIVLCGGTAIRKLREIMDNKVEVNVAVGSEEFGIKAYRYEAPFLTMDFVRHDIFDATGNSDEMLFIDPDHYELVNYKGGELGYVSEKKGMPFASLADNDEMVMQDAHYGAYSLEYRFEEASSLVTGFSPTISS